LQESRKSTQRARLIEAMGELAVQEGYLDVSVAQVIAAAGVSRRTFYEYFAAKDECFLAAVSEVQDGLLGELRRVVGAAAPQDAMRAAIEALVTLASSSGTRARLWLVEAMAGGARLLDARDRGVAEIGEMVQARYALAAADTPLADVSAPMLIGGVCRLLAWKLAGEASLVGVGEELVGWTRSYERPLSEHRWRSLEEGRMPPGPSLSPPLRAPIAIPRGATRSARAELEHNQRQRILFAAAQVAEREGYARAKVAEIASLAGVDARAFRRLFASKQDVFAAVHELYFQHIVTVSARAFAVGETWPEQVWQAGRAFTQLVEQNPAFAHIAFVEAHAAGPGAMRRHQELVIAFTVFLQEGYRQLTPGVPAPSSLALEAIALTNFEIAYRRCRAGASAQLTGLLPHVTYLSLAPFLGATEANRFIDRELVGS
jgi:AcrR family transcriptional regulator